MRRSTSIANPGERRSEPVDAALAQAHGLHASGAAAAARLEGPEGARDVVAVRPEALGEHESVLERQHAALRQVGQHGMCGIPHQHDAAGRPTAQRRHAIERPFAPLRHAGQDLRQTRMEPAQLAEQERRVGFRLPIPPLPIFPGDHDDGNLRARPHRIVHDMHAGRQP